MQSWLDNITIYRFWRLRRLILVGVALPFACFLTMAVRGYAGPLWAAGVPLVLASASAAMTLFYAQRYPRAIVDLLAFSLATAAVILLVPLGDWLLAQVKTTPDGRHSLGLIVLGLAAWLVLGLSFGSAISRLILSGKRRSYHLRTVWNSTLPPTQILPLLMPQPGLANAMRRYGNAEPDGRFAVWESVLGNIAAPSAGPWGKPENRPPDYWVLNVTQTDATSFTALFATPDAGTEALVLRAQPDGSGSRMIQDSQSDVMTPAQRVLRYLIDSGTDLAVADTDLAEGRGRVRANCLQPVDYPGKAWVERLKAQESTPPLF